MAPNLLSLLWESSERLLLEHRSEAEEQFSEANMFCLADPRQACHSVA